MARKPPWKRTNPATKHEKLSAKRKVKARLRARRAGRAYPNLVDNMAEAKAQKAGTRKKPAKR